ncbi:MAG: response regulator transcription factor [Planctomycetota bacterium]|nr:response regulator transcription factor [Planctomycetota bacterium]
MRILIVDDDPVARRILEDAVGGLGHTVHVAHDGREAWDLLSHEPVDVLMTDWVMPEMDGLELCQRVRARTDAPFMYVMLVTERSTTDDVVDGIMAGANDFLTKPYERAELRARLHAAQRVVELERSLAERVHELESALSEVATLRRLLPICMYCHSIRNEKQVWDEIEEYLRDHANADCTHSICPTCYDHRVRPMLDEMKSEQKAS